ncbi:FliM/FliN family flagellar motor switch protein [Paracoccus sp. MBLB3053]|uniref:FliM/FliN family flagellar motor switch protein n=1 Tax=Paracoccus aurantius TaxID=3073814 RepID=A0ABU2HVQ5_9RHOB|nr:FliM/FliN family flagellar motor switch protein [Paracoccus sp. MBLB3053]MDS9468635.1 FliM/FliN family flagellar motor switch protein [Paracoccus sp. MBLB3053]
MMDKTGAAQSNGEGNGNRIAVLRRLIAERARARGLSLAQGQDRLEIPVDRAAAMALGRAAEKQHRLAVFVEKVTEGQTSLSEIAELLPEQALLAVVEGGPDQLGVVALCPAFLASVIEMQALGRVTSRQAQPRRPTRTDAAISAEFVNGLLAELGREFALSAEMPGFAAFRYATYLDDARPLGLMLEDGPMYRLSLSFRIGSGGQRDGQILVALPTRLAEDAPSARRNDHAQIQALPPLPQAIRTSLAGAVQKAPVQLRGILCRRKVSLQALRGMKSGTLIPLPPNALNDARVETAGGQLLARGRLGEIDGFHAIRLQAGCDEQSSPEATSTTTRLIQETAAPENRSSGLDLDRADPVESSTAQDFGDLRAAR